MSGFTYVLKSAKDGKLYIGSTTDLIRRLKDHNSGKNKSTQNRKPFEIVYSESFSTVSEARKREMLFKKSHSILYRAAGWRDTHN